MRMGSEIPASLSIGTQVSAKYKGAFCEAKVRSVVKSVKVRVTFRNGLGSATLSDEGVKCEGPLVVGASVRARHPEKGGEMSEAVVNKIQDQSQYTVVFDDGDITTLRRNALCMKSGKHYNASESLDNLPLTHPEHFGTPVGGGSSRRRKRAANEESEEDTSSESEEGGVSSCYLANIGRVVWAENTDNKKSKSKETWFPALIVAPSASDTVKINTKEEFLIRSFKDGRYYTVSKKDTNKFQKDSNRKPDNQLIKEAMDKAVTYIETKELPPHWDKENLFNMGNAAEESSTESSESEEIDDDEDEESREEKDHLVAELYKHMEDRGAPINRTPNIVGKDLDLYKLFRIVYKYGGHQRVTNNNKWRQIAHKLGFETTWCVNQVRVNYKRYLQSFEELYKTLGCTMKSGTSSRQRQGSGSGTSGRVQIRGKSRAMLQQQTSSGGKDSNNSANEDGGTECSKEPIAIPTSLPASTNETPSPSDKPVNVVKKNVTASSTDEDDAKESNEDAEEGKVSTPGKKSIKEKKGPTFPKNESSSSKRNKEDSKTISTRTRRDSSSSSISNITPVKGLKEEHCPPLTVKKENTETESTKKINKVVNITKTEPPEDLTKGPKGRKKIKENNKKASNTSTTSASSSTASIAGNDPTSSSSNPSEELVDSKTCSPDSSEEEPQHLTPDVDVRVGDRIRVFYIREIIYDAKVIKCQEQEKNNSKWPRYYVHYLGWNARYDEWINRSRISDNLSWTKDRPKKEGKEDSSDSSSDKSSFKKEKSKVDGRKERKVMKRESTSRAGTPSKSRTDSPVATNKRSNARGSSKKIDSDGSDVDDDEELEKNIKRSTATTRSANKKTTLQGTQRRGRGRKRKEESENEDVEIEKDVVDEAVEVTSSPSKAKRGRKSAKELLTNSSVTSLPVKKEEVQTRQSPSSDSPSKKVTNRATPVREQRTSTRNTPAKVKESEKKPAVVKKEEENDDKGKNSEPKKEEDEEDPYAFKEPEPFEEVKFETPPRKVSTPPATSSTPPLPIPSVVIVSTKKNLDKELSSVSKPKKDGTKKEVASTPLEEDQPKNEKIEESVLKKDEIVEDETVKEEKKGCPSIVIAQKPSLPLKVDEEEDDNGDDSDDEGKLEIVTPKKEFEDSPTKSPPSEDKLPKSSAPLNEKKEKPPVIEIKKSPERLLSDDPGKPVLQLTEKQKELFPYLSAIRTASLGLISSISPKDVSKVAEKSSPEIKIEVTTVPSKKHVNITPTSGIILSGTGTNVKKRKSHRRFNSSELVESETESDSDDIKTSDEPKKEDVVASPSTKPITTYSSKRSSKTYNDGDDVDLACAEIIPRSPVHPGISDSTCLEVESVIEKDDKVKSTVLEVKKLEMPFATVPESGLEPSLPEIKPSADNPLLGPSKPVVGKTEKNDDVEPVLLTASVEKVNNVVKSDDSTTSVNLEILQEPPNQPASSLVGNNSPTGDSISDMDSLSGRNKADSEDSRLDVEGSSSGDAPPANQNTVQSTLNRRSATANKRKLVDKISDPPRSPAQKRKRRTREAACNPVSSSASSSSLRSRGGARGRHSSGRVASLRGNIDEETDESEETKDSSTLNSLGSLDDQALAALSQRSPKSSKYNFYVELDPSMDSSERISLIQNNLEELRKTYMNIKSELAIIERRRKKIRRKERERGNNGSNSSSSGSSNGGTKNNPTHIEVTA